LQGKNNVKTSVAASVANFWQKISAKSSEKFGRQRKSSAAHIILA
jgi:hypothetical protein